MIRIVIPSFIKEKGILNDDILKDICNRSFKDDKYAIEYENKENYHPCEQLQGRLWTEFFPGFPNTFAERYPLR